MEKIFKDTQGNPIKVVEHTLEILKKCPYVDIHIGTDSQNQKNYTQYVTVIAYRYGTRGVHIIYTRNKIKKIKDKWSRLWKEAELSVEVAVWFREKINVDIEIDLDYNSDAKYYSNVLVNSAQGWITSLGFKSNIKPNNQIATYAADSLCR